MAAVDWERRGSAGWVRLNRPDRRNAIDVATRRGLAEAFTLLESDPEVGVIVLTGTGSMFCAGVDLHEPTPERGLLDLGEQVSAPIERCPLPVVAAMNGPAVGGGFELALACDMRVATDTAWFALTELRIGSLPGSGGTQRLFESLPPAVAWKMLLTGSRISASEAERFGLISDVFDEQSFESDVAELISNLAGAAPLSVRAAKMAHAAGRAGNSGMAMERLLWRMLVETEDRAEGRAAFREKRAPRFRGR
ncbi:enoyl-CoA hydratase [Mycolicibacterium litorale]|uniref:Enoyl-CoA hydratase n=1 Tax=Mycolicibacterium litorale TaxID=758802 RepID=A0A6S6P005_9MYCO|nr:enoyl-CoA hydratase/isomerase family protein [Mycolicibacterium litorale]BCI51789.1 enoyl-CoA hydratase [Mycolicibacterium litorale]